MTDYIQRLKNNAWAIMPVGEKKEILASIEDEIARITNRKARPIVFMNTLFETHGAYNENKDSIILNNDVLCEAGIAIYAVLHEGRHAAQYDSISELSNSNTANATYTIWAKNWKGYLDPRDKGVERFEYYLQPIEKDANMFALSQLKKIATKTKDAQIMTRFKLFQNELIKHKMDAEAVHGKQYEKAIQSKIDAALNGKARLISYSEAMSSLKYNDSTLTEDGYSDTITPLFSKDKIKLARKYGLKENALEKSEHILKKNNTRKKKKCAPTITSKKDKTEININFKS